MIAPRTQWTERHHITFQLKEVATQGITEVDTYVLRPIETKIPDSFKPRPRSGVEVHMGGIQFQEGIKIGDSRRRLTGVLCSGTRLGAMFLDPLSAV